MNIKKTLKSVGKFALVLLVLSGLSYSTLKLPEWHKQYLFSSVGDNVVYIKTLSGSGGTGFVVRLDSKIRVVVTNHHVCTLSEAFIMTPLHEVQPVHILASDEANDVCLVSYNGRIKGLTIKPVDLLKGRPIYILGHPALNPLTLSIGNILGKADVPIVVGQSHSREGCGNAKPFPWISGFICVKVVESYLTNAQIQAGSSGSPVVDDVGNVIGVVFAGDRFGWGVFVDAKHVVNLIEKIK